MSTENFKDFENIQDTKVGWYLAVTQEVKESLRLSDLAYEVTDVGGYDKPLEDFKLWFVTKLLRFFSDKIKEIQKENKKVAKKEYDIKAPEYKEWLETKLNETSVELDDTEKKFGVSELEKKYIQLGLSPEIVNMNLVMNNDEFTSIAEQSPEYMGLSNEAKSYTLNTAIDLINKYRDVKDVVNDIDGGNFNYDWFPIELMHPYASGDTDVCRRIHCDVVKKLEEQDRPKSMHLLEVNYPRLTKSLARIESNGLYCDLDYMKENDESYESEMTKNHATMREHWAVKEFEEYQYNLYQMALEEHEKKPKERDKDIHQYRDKFKDGKWMFSPSSGDHKGRVMYDILGIQLPYDKEYVKEKPFNANVKEADLTWQDYKTDKKAISYALDNLDLKDDVKELLELLKYHASMQTKRNSFTKKLPNMVNKQKRTLHGSFSETGTECIAGDSLLITSEGIKEIKDLGTTRSDKTFEDLKLLVPNHNNSISETDAFYYSGKGKSLIITLENGLELVTSYNHPLRRNNYYSRGKNFDINSKTKKHIKDFSWVESSNLKQGDYIQVSNNTNMYGNKVELDTSKHEYRKKLNTVPYVLPKKLTYELSEFIGMFMADGNIKYENGSKTLVITNNSCEVLERAKFLIKELFDIQAVVCKPINRTPYVRFSSKGLVTWLEDTFTLVTGALNKNVPNIILQSTKEVQEGFIKGLSLDSSVKKKDYPSIYFSSISKDMMRKLNIMLNNMGYMTRFSTTKDNRGYNDCYQVQLTYEYALQYLNTIGFEQSNKEHSLQKNINFYKEEGKFKTKKEGYLCFEDTVIVKIKSIKDNGYIDLFDLHVPNEHSFVANSIVNHNTSRLSSSNPNLQNLPSHTSDVNKFDYKHPIKRSFVSRFENGVLLGADYSALEMRIIGLFTKDPDMLQSFLNGEDIHKATASIVYNKSVEEVTKEERQATKAVNFGLAFGESPFSFAGKNNMSVEEAEDIFEKYFQTKPSVKTSIDSVHEFVQQYGYVDTMHGHRRFIRSAQSADKKIKNEGLRQSFNTIIQGSGSFLTNMSLTYLDDFIQSRNLKSKVIATVHDSILIDCPPEEAKLMAKVTIHVMENLPFDFLKAEIGGKEVQYPIKADMEIGLNYNDMVEYDEEEIETFNSYQGYIKYMMNLQTLEDYKESGKLTDEQFEKATNVVKGEKSIYQEI